MKRFILFLALTAVASSLKCKNACSQPTLGAARLTDYVNPFIGTGRIEGALRGNNYPGATVPFGLVQLSPDTREAPDWDCPAGYAYEENVVYGFSHTHLSGTGAADLIDILLLPTSSEKRCAAIDHASEQAHPGYYSVRLTDDDILAELTATAHTGVHRYTYAEGARQQIYLDLDHSAAKGSWGRRIEKAQLRIIDAHTVEGYRLITGWAPLRKVCFSVRFSKPIVAVHGWNDGRELEVDGISSLFFNGTDLKATFTFAGEGTRVFAQVGISAVSIENARLNREHETADLSFDALCTSARAQWESVLGGIKARFSSDADATIFYTALYHAMQQPSVFSDVNGDYVRADFQIGRAREGHAFYTMFSIWDTYRAAHALYDLLQPARAADMAMSMIDHAEHYGYLPIWELWGQDNYCMIGNHAVSILVEAIRKEVPGIDEHAAWRAVRQSLTTPHRDSPWPLWERLGYMPENLQTQSVSITLEDAYDDWCAARLAERLGLTDEMEHFDSLARNYRNLYNAESALFQPKDDKGRWMEGFDPLRYGANGGSAYTEGNAWQWRWSVQHDIDDLIALSGGQKSFLGQLDYFFTCKDTSGQRNDNASGFIGLYAHGNEPSHHVAFLYALAGQPQKTDQLVDYIRRTMYTADVSGYIGNDDCGEMSAWYVFAALGLYPVNPASADYVLFAPSVREATIRLPNGKSLCIETSRRASKAAFVKEIRWNGRKLKQPRISHHDLLQGGSLHFELTTKPNGDFLQLR